MYKVLIADDELLVQIGLRSIVDYAKLGLELVDVAKNGREAYAVLVREKPDIVVLDIKMPVMSGLDVIERFTAEKPYSPEPVFILLTNCDDFDSARTAIRLNAFDYLIKVELNAEIFGDVLGRAAAFLDAQSRLPAPAEGPSDSTLARAMLVDKFYQKLINGWFVCQEEVERARRELGIEAAYPRYSILYFDLLRKGEAMFGQANLDQKLSYINDLIQTTCNKYNACYVTPWNAYSFTVILGVPGAEEGGAALLEECAADVISNVDRLIGVRMAAGIGSAAELLNISLSFREAIAAYGHCTEQRPVSARHEAADLSAAKHTDFVAHAGKRLIDGISGYQAPEIQAVFADIKGFFQHGEANARQAAAICSSLIHYISVSNHKAGRVLTDLFSPECNPYYELMFLRSIAQVFQWLDDLENALCQRVREDYERKRSWMVTSIKGYIEDHYQEPLSLTDVADAFGVSAGYISTMFKKYNDTGFTECVTQSKILHAMNLLEQGELKIFEISQAVGYGDPYYFSKVFKRITGVTPKDYAISRRTSTG